MANLDGNSGSRNVNTHGSGTARRLYIEDLDLGVTADLAADAWCQFLAPLISTPIEIFARRFAILDDETMSFLWETATQIDTRIRLDPETRTVAQGALWVEESPPPETILVGLLAAEQSRCRRREMTPDGVLGFVLSEERVLQLGGKATVGRGRCRLIPVRRRE